VSTVAEAGDGVIFAGAHDVRKWPVPAPNPQPPMTADYLQAAFRALKDCSTQ